MATSPITLTPTTLGFGLVGCGTTAERKTVKLSNASTNPVSFSTAFNFGVNYTADPPGGIIPPGGFVNIDVVPNPQPQTGSPGTSLADTMVITTDAPNDTPRNVAISGTLAGAFLNFLSTGGSNISILAVSRTNGVGNFNLRNTGNIPVTITLTQSNPAQFTLTQSGQLSLPNGQNIGDGVFYTGPATAGIKTLVQFSAPSAPICQEILPTLTIITQLFEQKARLPQIAGAGLFLFGAPRRFVARKPA